MDYTTIHGILQARTLEWVAIPFSRESSQSRDQIWVSCIAGGFFIIWANNNNNKNEVAQLCLNLCDPTDCSLPSSSIHAIFQARVLEWGAISFSELLLYFILIQQILMSAQNRWGIPSGHKIET